MCRANAFSISPAVIHLHSLRSCTAFVANNGRQDITTQLMPFPGKIRSDALQCFIVKCGGRKAKTSPVCHSEHYDDQSSTSS